MMTMTELVERMVVAGDLDADAPARIEAALAGRRQDSTPWYLHGLAAIGSWIAGVLLLAAFAAADLLSSGGSAVFIGLLLCAAAVALRLAVARSGVFTQVPLTMALAGALIVLSGLWLIDDAFLGLRGEPRLSLALAGLALLELVMIVVYRDQLHRFLATLAICAALVSLLLINDLHLVAALFGVALGWSVVMLWTREATLARVDEVARPVMYGLTLALLGVVWALLLASDTTDWLLSGGLAAALASQAWRLMEGASLSLRAAALAAITLVLVFAWGSPGLLAAPLVMVIGFSRGNRAVLALGALFMASYVIFYYYNLELNLLLKSFALLGSGVALLGIRFALARGIAAGGGL